MGIQSLKERYKANTPYKMRRIGDALTVAIPVLQGAVLGVPFNEMTKGLVLLAIAVILSGAKFITNFYTETPEDAELHE